MGFLWNRYYDKTLRSREIFYVIFLKDIEGNTSLNISQNLKILNDIVGLNKKKLFYNIFLEYKFSSQNSRRALADKIIYKI